MPSQNAAQQQSQLVAVVDKDMDPSPQELEAAHAEIQVRGWLCVDMMMQEIVRREYRGGVGSDGEELTHLLTHLTLTC